MNSELQIPSHRGEAFTATHRRQNMSYRNNMVSKGLWGHHVRLWGTCERTLRDSAAPPLCLPLTALLTQKPCCQWFSPFRLHVNLFLRKQKGKSMLSWALLIPTLISSKGPEGGLPCTSPAPQLCTYLGVDLPPQKRPKSQPYADEYLQSCRESMQFSILPSPCIACEPLNSCSFSHLYAEEQKLSPYSLKLQHYRESGGYASPLISCPTFWLLLSVFFLEEGMVTSGWYESGCA